MYSVNFKGIPNPKDKKGLSKKSFLNANYAENANERKFPFLYAIDFKIESICVFCVICVLFAFLDSLVFF